MIISIALAALVFIGMVVVFYRQEQQKIHSAAAISLSQKVLYQTAKVLSTITDNETGSRGFILTGNDDFLEPLNRSKAAIHLQIDQLKNLTSNNPSRERANQLLQFYVNKRVGFSDSTVALRKEKGLSAAISMVSSGRGKLYQDSIRVLVDQMTRDENTLLAQWEKNNDKQVKIEQLIFLAIALIVLTLIIILFWKQKKQIEEKERKKSEGQLELLSLQINQSSDAIYTMDAGRKIKSWNNGAEKMYGFTKEEALMRDPNELLQTDISKEEITSALQLIAVKDHLTREVKRKTKAGNDIIVRASTTTIRDGNNNITGYVSVNIDVTANKKLQDDVIYLAKMVEQTTEAIISTGLDQRIISWNGGAEKLHGFAKEEALGKTALELGIIQLPAVQVRDELQQLIETGAWKKEMYVYRKDGSSFFGVITANQLKNELGEITAVLFIIKDITDRRRLEEQLKKYNEELEIKINERTEIIEKSEKQYRYLFENNPMPMFVMDLATFKFLDVNDIAIIYYGYSREEFLSMTALDIRPAEETELFKKLDFSFGNHSENYNKGIWKHRKKDGTIIQVEIIAHEILFEGNPSRLIMCNDVTVQKKTEEKLISSEKRFRALVENNYDIITLIDESFKIIYRSPSVSRVMGYPPSEVELWEGIEYIHPDDREYAAGMMREASTHPGKPVRLMFRRQHKNGHYIWLEGVITNMLHDADTRAYVSNFRDVTERIEWEEKLASSEIRFRSLIENSAEGISLTDEFFNVIYRSPASVKITGIPNGENKLNQIHPEDLDMIQQKRAEATMKPGVPINFQGRHLHPEGHYFWMEGTLTNMMNVKGVGVIVSNHRDVTGRKVLEELLNNANVLARIGGWEVNLEKNTVFWTDITREIHETAYDYKPNLESGLHFYKEGAGRTLIEQKVKDAIELGKPWDVELQIITAKNKERWIRTIGETEFINGKCTRIYGSFQDIDQRKKAEEKLVESEKLYRNLFTNMLHGFAYCKVIFEGETLTDYTYLAVNQEYEKLTGLKDITGKNMSEVIPGLLQSDPAYADLMTSVSTTGKSEKFETFIQPLDQWFSVSLYSPEKGYFVSLVDNITDRKLVEQKITRINSVLEEKVIMRTEQLRKSNNELEAFSYSVSHDLRAPLRAVIGYTSMLEEDYGDKLDDEAKRITAVIKSNTLKMGNLIDDLLAFSRLGRQAIVKATVNTNEMVGEVRAQVDNQVYGGRKINWVIHDLPVIQADAGTIRQVWFNLLSNASKYTGNRTDPTIEIGSFKNNKQTTFFVKDNGVGFDEKYKDKLFKVFQRLHSAHEFEGTGIGLAIVEKIVSKHGGSVQAEASVNKGASFYFSLPEN